MQYALAKKTNQGVRELMKLLKQEGFKITQGLDDVKDDENIIGICVDFTKKITFRLGITSMACWCTISKSKPLFVEEVVEYFDELIHKKNFDLYFQLIKERSVEKDRPGGILISMNKK